jgi:hypothetical protein
MSSRPFSPSKVDEDSRRPASRMKFNDCAISSPSPTYSPPRPLPCLRCRCRRYPLRRPPRLPSSVSRQAYDFCPTATVFLLSISR